MGTVHTAGLIQTKKGCGIKNFRHKIRYFHRIISAYPVLLCLYATAPSIFFFALRPMFSSIGSSQRRLFWVLCLSHGSEQLHLLLHGILDGLGSGSQKLAGIKALALLILACLDVLAGSCVFTLIFATPREIAFLIMSAGMPVPP